MVFEAAVGPYGISLGHADGSKARVDLDIDGLDADDTNSGDGDTAPATFTIDFSDGAGEDGRLYFVGDGITGLVDALAFDLEGWASVQLPVYKTDGTFVDATCPTIKVDFPLDDPSDLLGGSYQLSNSGACLPDLSSLFDSETVSDVVLALEGARAARAARGAAAHAAVGIVGRVPRRREHAERAGARDAVPAD